MPDYILNRNHTHRSTHGHIIQFVKGQPTYVVPICEKEVLAFGAEPCEGEKLDLLDDMPHLPVAPQGADREAALFVAFEMMEERNQRGDFTGQGRPHPKVLREIVGFDVETRERDTTWEAYLTKKAAK
jgi:hypothetical protein